MVSKNRPLWADLPAAVRARVEALVADRVVGADSCGGGFSPGFASRLRLAGGGRVFVKAVDARRWPADADLQRAEAWAAGVLPAGIPAPAFLGADDDGSWVILTFEDVDGAEPGQPWDRDQLRWVVAAAEQLAATAVCALPADHPRLGGWAELAADPARADRLAAYHRWAGTHLDRLLALEQDGLAAAQGSCVVHFDLYPHNILLRADRVVFVDWPHARLGAPFVDLVITLSSAPAAEAEDLMREQQTRRGFDPDTVTAVLAAHAGFCLAGGLATPPPGLEPIAAAKRHLGRGALTWLQLRLTTAGRPG